MNTDEARRLEDEYFTLVAAIDGMHAGTVMPDGKAWKEFALVDGCATWRPLPNEKAHAAMQAYVAAHSPNPMRRAAAKVDSAPATTAHAEPVKPAAPAPVSPSVADILASPRAIAALNGLGRSQNTEARSNWERIAAVQRGERSSVRDVPRNWQTSVDRAKVRVAAERNGKPADAHGWRASAQRVGAIE